MGKNRKKALTYPETTRGMNFFDVDRNLETFLRRSAPAMLRKREKMLSDLGEFVGNRLDKQAEMTDQDFQPSLKDVPNSRTKPTERKNELRLNPDYEDCQQELYRRGFVSSCFSGFRRESHILPFVAQYLVSQSDIATGCPFAMTHPVAYVLDSVAPKDVKNRFLPEILRTDGKTAVCGTWATERHSGSDVGGSITTAIPDIYDPSRVELNGHNWFTSAFGFNKFMAIKTARPNGAPAGGRGLGLYLVPSHVDTGWKKPNSLSITHLKRKLGTRGLPTVEVELKNTVAYEVAPAGQGIKAMMAALGCSRVHNAMAAAGVMHRSYMEALCWTSHRETFGEKLIDRPMVQKRILDIGTQWMAGSALAFEAAKSFDEAASDPSKAHWMRVTTALAKFKTAEQAVWCAQKALELTGGNGYTEDYPTARQFRDAMVLPVWEGPEQIQALELMRMIAGKEPGDRLFVEKLESIRDALPPEMATERTTMTAMIGKIDASLKELRQSPAKMEQVADEFLHKMSDVLAYALLCDEATWELANDSNMEKILIARRYHEMTFENGLSQVEFKQSELQKHFNDVVRGRGVEPKSGGPRQDSAVNDNKLKQDASKPDVPKDDPKP